MILTFRTGVRNNESSNQMSEMVAVSYPNQEAAAASRARLMRLGPSELDEFADAIVASVDGFGHVELNQEVNLWSSQSRGATFFAVIMGLLFVEPLRTLFPSDAAIQISSALFEFGLTEQFREQILGMLVPGHAVLFMMLNKSEQHLIETLEVDPGSVGSCPKLDMSKLDGLEAAFQKGLVEAKRQRDTTYSSEYGVG